MPHQLVITAAKTGPDRNVAGSVLNNITKLEFGLDKKVLKVGMDTVGGAADRELDIGANTVVTFAISAGNYTVTIA